MKQRIYNGNSLEFYNEDNSKKGELRISGSDIVINPIDSGGTVIFGEEGSINDIEVGASGTAVDFTFVGGGAITSNGGTLTVGKTGDTVDLSNATIGTITASIFKGGAFLGDGSGLTSVPSTFTHITASGNISASGTGLFGAVSLQDNEKIFIGTGDDLQIYHDGSHSRIKDAGVGHLILNATDFVVNNSADSANMIIATDGGAVSLYCNAALKFATTSTGVSIVGNASASGNIIANTYNSLR